MKFKVLVGLHSFLEDARENSVFLSSPASRGCPHSSVHAGLPPSSKSAMG